MESLKCHNNEVIRNKQANIHNSSDKFLSALSNCVTSILQELSLFISIFFASL